LLVVRILDHGRQRSTNRDPRTALAILRRTFGGPAGRLLESTLDTDALSRPTMADWFAVTNPGHAQPRVPRSRPGAPTGVGLRTGQTSNGWTWVEGTGWVRQ